MSRYAFIPYSSRTRTIDRPVLAFRQHKAGEPWPFTDCTLPELVPPDEETFQHALPKEWIGWYGEEAVALLIIYSAGTNVPHARPGDMMMHLTIAMEGKEYLFNPLIAYQEAFDFVLSSFDVERVIIEAAPDNNPKIEILSALGLRLLANQDPVRRMKYYLFE